MDSEKTKYGLSKFCTVTIWRVMLFRGKFKLMSVRGTLC